MRKNILIFGPQGSGKGTISLLLKKKLNIPHISVGDLLRETTQKKTPLGEKINQIIMQGMLVSPDIICELLKHRLEEKDVNNGFILDGFPRNQAQAELMSSIAEVDKVIMLDIPEELSIQRIEGRIQCEKCGAIYNIVSKPPKQENICDVCLGHLYHRADDTSEILMKRLKIYNVETKPLIQRYQDRLISIDGSLPSEESLELIIKALST